MSQASYDQTRLTGDDQCIMLLIVSLFSHIIEFLSLSLDVDWRWTTTGTIPKLHMNNNMSEEVVHYNKSGLWWWNQSSQYVLISSPNTYGDEMVTKQCSSPKLRHRMYWWRKCFVTNKKMIGDEIFSSPIKNDRWQKFFVT